MKNITLKNIKNKFRKLIVFRFKKKTIRKSEISSIFILKNSKVKIQSGVRDPRPSKTSQP